MFSKFIIWLLLFCASYNITVSVRVRVNNTVSHSLILGLQIPGNIGFGFWFCLPVTSQIQRPSVQSVNSEKKKKMAVFSFQHIHRPFSRHCCHLPAIGCMQVYLPMLLGTHTHTHTHTHLEASEPMKQAGVIQEKQTFALLVPSDAQRVQPYWSRWSHSDTENLWTLQWVCQCSNIWKGEVTCVLVSHVQEGQKPGFNWVNTDTSNPTVWWVCLVLCQLGSTIVRHLRHSSLLCLNKCVIMCSLVFMFFAQQCFPTEINPSQQIKSSNQAGSTLIVTIYHWLYIKMDHVIDLSDTKTSRSPPGDWLQCRM